uniref:Uncharacterized protein n=1 Tax=Acrobeloides nanus TaxID=290746 RepID=A0A914ECC3_9BILA
MFDEKLLNPFIATTWIWGAMILGLTLSPLVSQLYDINTSSWSYSPNKPINWPPIELAIAISQVSLGGVFYLIIMLKLIIHKKSNHIDTSYKNEIRLLIAIIITIYVALGNAYWNFLYNYVYDPHLAGFIGNMILIIQNGMNPFLYLTMSKHADIWIYNSYFNVTCAHGQVQVLNCITDKGTQITIGTDEFWEDGMRYSCRNQSTMPEKDPEPEGSGFENTHFAEECDRGEPVYVREHFMISCEKHEVIGCIDAYGDVVKIGYFVAERNRLKYCYVYPNGRKARIENKGCFNGSRDDDPEDKSLHITKYKIWQQGNFDLRCGDDGISIYKCYIGTTNKTVHTGTAWFDEHDVLNVCK